MLLMSCPKGWGKQLPGVPFMFEALSAGPARAAESTNIEMGILGFLTPAGPSSYCIWRTPIPTNPHRSAAIPPCFALPIPPTHPQNHGVPLTSISLPRKLFLYIHVLVTNPRELGLKPGELSWDFKTVGRAQHHFPQRFSSCL